MQRKHVFAPDRATAGALPANAPSCRIYGRLKESAGQNPGHRPGYPITLVGQPGVTSRGALVKRPRLC